MICFELDWIGLFARLQFETKIILISEKLCFLESRLDTLQKFVDVLRLCYQQEIIKRGKCVDAFLPTIASGHFLHGSQKFRKFFAPANYLTITTVPIINPILLFEGISSNMCFLGFGSSLNTQNHRCCIWWIGKLMKRGSTYASISFFDDAGYTKHEIII